MTGLEGGGRLAMVAPAELCHAAYARPLLRLLRDRFRSVRVLTFARRLFPRLNEDTVLVLGEGYGESGGDIRLVSLKDSAELGEAASLPWEGTPVSNEEVSGGVVRLISYLLPDSVRQLYESLACHPSVFRSGTPCLTCRFPIYSSATCRTYARRSP